MNRYREIFRKIYRYNRKKSTFIGYVNKLACNYNHLQLNILMNLFKTNGCFLHMILIYENSTPNAFSSYREKVTAWNVAGRRLMVTRSTNKATAYSIALYILSCYGMHLV